MSVREALSDIEAGNTQILIADKEYYKQHKETFKVGRFLNKPSFSNGTSAFYAKR